MIHIMIVVTMVLLDCLSCILAVLQSRSTRMYIMPWVYSEISHKLFHILLRLSFILTPPLFLPSDCVHIEMEEQHSSSSVYYCDCKHVKGKMGEAGLGTRLS